MNPGWSRYGEVTLQPDGKIRVGVYSHDAANLDRIKGILAATGHLEFRILANAHDHADVIEKARASKGRVVFDPEREGKAKQVARWQPVAKTEQEAMRQSRQVIGRDDGAGDLEVLVVLDDLNLTGDYLRCVQASFDQIGRPCVTFALNSAGSQKLGEITTMNLPDAVQGFKRQLAIILDGEIMTAPSINSAIYDRGEITGNFTVADTQLLAAILTAGQIPAPIKLVSETKVAP